jgi:hypothetical protein
MSVKNKQIKKFMMCIVRAVDTDVIISLGCVIVKCMLSAFLLKETKANEDKMNEMTKAKKPGLCCGKVDCVRR